MSKLLRPPVIMALTWLSVLYACVLAADLLAPYEPDEQRRNLASCPPTPIRLFDRDGRLSRPFVCGMARTNSTGAFVEDCSRAYPIRLFSRVQVSPDSPRFTRRLFTVAEPGAILLLGTDQLGRDRFSRFLHGGRLSLTAGFLACAIALLIASVVGIISGFYGGAVDHSLMWTAEVFLSLPWLFMLIGIRALLPLNLTPALAFLTVIAVIGFVGWAKPARLIRNVVLSAKERDYVLASRGLGASDWFVIRKHVWPNAFSVVLTQFSLTAPRFILAEVVLSYCGLGVNEPAASWGQMLSSITEGYLTGHLHVAAFLPVLCVLLTCFSFLIVARSVNARFPAH